MPPKRKTQTKPAAKADAPDPELPEYMTIGNNDSESESDESDSGEAVDHKDEVEVSGPMEVDEATMKSTKKRIAKVAIDKNAEPGVCYLGNIPFGFYEDEMRTFFGQFGAVTRLRMSRSKKTGRSRGYAFVEFEHKEVAEIVAETMNNYLMFNRLLKCQLVPAEKVHEETFKNADRAFRTKNWRKIEQSKRAKARTVAQQDKVVTRLVKKESKKRAALADMGIDYEFPGYAAAADFTEKKSTKKPTKKQATAESTTASKTSGKQTKAEPTKKPAVKDAPASAKKPAAKVTPASTKKSAVKDAPTPAVAGKKSAKTPSDSKKTASTQSTAQKRKGGSQPASAAKGKKAKSN